MGVKFDGAYATKNSVSGRSLRHSPCTDMPHLYSTSGNKNISIHHIAYRHWAPTYVKQVLCVYLYVACGLCIFTHRGKSVQPCTDLEAFGKKEENYSLETRWCAADFSLLNLPKGKSLGRSKPATNS